ncbi:hypothetical protein Tco_0464773 [Tanacetum coccineum]
MALSIADQIALDDALVAPAECQLKIDENKNTRRAMRCTILGFTKLVVNYVHGKKDLHFLEEKGSIGPLLPEMTQCSRQSMSSQGMKLTQLTESILQQHKDARRKALQIQSLNRSLPLPPKKRNEEWGLRQEFRCIDYDSEDDISWKSSDDDQDDEDAEGLPDEDDSRISSSDDEDSDNEVEGANVEGAKTDEDATYEEDQGNEAVEYTNTDLDGRDDVMTDVILPQTCERVRWTSSQILGTTIRSSCDVASQIEELELKKHLILKVEAKQLYQQTAGKTTVQESRLSEICLAICSSREAMKSTNVFKTCRPGVRNNGVQDEQAERRGFNNLPELVTTTTRLHSMTHAWEYVCSCSSESVQPCRKYSTSVTKTTAADYGHIKWIEDLVPNSMWSQTIVKYDRFALWGISHWGKKRRQFYAFATSRESARDVYSKRRIIAVTKVEIVEWHDYKHLDWITVRRDDDVLYKFKEGDFHRLRIQDIEDMLLLLVQGKVTNLSVEERIAFNVSLRMFTRRVVIQRRVEDLQLGVESYQKKLNLTKPDTYRSNLRRQDAYTPYSDPRGFIYENKDKKNRLMRIDELHKFSDGPL